MVTLGRRGQRGHLLADVEALGAEVVETDRGGEVTYHGPGQLVGYPILTVAGKRGGGMADTAAYVRGLEQVLIDVLAGLGLDSGRVDRHPGVWVDPAGPRPRKVAAIGVRLTRARSMHGFALNVDPDLGWFGRIVPCGVAGMAVTSLAAEGLDMSVAEVAERVADRASAEWAPHGRIDRAGVAHRVTPGDLAPFTRAAEDRNRDGGREPAGEPDRVAEGRRRTEKPDRGAEDCNRNGDRRESDAGPGGRLQARLASAGVAADDQIAFRSRKPEWMKVRLDTGPAFRQVRSTLRDLNLVTVCEEAGCPNISECWNDGTATFMILGDRCTRACGFCLVDTRRPGPPDVGEPDRVAEAAARMGLEHVVVTMVARDDLDDGGAAAMAATVEAVRDRLPAARVETLISDLGSSEAALQTVFEARPDVLNHNIETVARLQRAVRPQASYARSLSVLARAADAGLTAKSSLIAGMGETDDEIVQTLADLRSAGADIVTIGQYLRPSPRHLPVARWWAPDDFTRWKQAGEALGIAHVESSPLTRSSYHARQAATTAATAAAGGASRAAADPVVAAGRAAADPVAAASRPAADLPAAASRTATDPLPPAVSISSGGTGRP